MGRQRIHREIVVRGQGEGVHLDLSLPPGRLRGVQACATWGKDHFQSQLNGTRPPAIAGELALRLRTPADIFFQQEVRFTEGFEDGYFRAGIGLPDELRPEPDSLWISGKRLQSFTLDQPVNVPLLSVYYRDRVNEAMGLSAEYPVTLILDYES